MTPSELNARIGRIEQRLRSVMTAGASLVLLALLAPAVALAHRLDPGLARTVAILSIAGTALLVGVARMLQWDRWDAYDDVILSGFRHVHRTHVDQHAQRVVTLAHRRSIADALERMVEAADGRRRLPVPLNRRGLVQCAPQVRAIACVLRCRETTLEPAGIVLARRLVTDGFTSPLFRPQAPVREVQRQLDRIVAELGVDLPLLIAA